MIAAGAALLLLAAAVASWFVALAARPAARVQLRFAAVLFSAIAADLFVPPPASSAVVLLVLPIALAVLALGTAAGIARPAPPAFASAALAGVCLGALGAVVTGMAALALAPAVVAAMAMAAVCVRAPSLSGVAAALCFAAAISAFARDGAQAAMALFCAAGVLGLSLALARSDRAVEHDAGPDLRRAAIGAGRGA